VSISPDEVRASIKDPGGTPSLPEAEIERIMQVLNQHRSNDTSIPADTPTASEPGGADN
jgi:hypothetical protein